MDEETREKIEFIILRAMTGATETLKYNLRHFFGDKIEKETAGNEEKIEEALSGNKFNAEQTIQCEIVKVVETEVIKTIRKIKK